MTARHIPRCNGPAVYTVSPGASLAETPVRLRQHSVGALVVSDGGAPVGMISERDPVRAVSERGVPTLSEPVAAEMSSPVETCAPDRGVREFMVRLTSRRIRHLPVVEGSRLVGVVSIGDVVRHRVSEIEADAAVLQDALTSRCASALAA